MKRAHPVTRVPLAGLATAGLLVTLSGSVAQAQTTTFAQYSQSAAGNFFTLVNNGTNSTLTATNVPVNFIYQVTSSYTGGIVIGNNRVVAGRLNFSATLATAATGTTNLSEAFQSVQFSFTANQAVNGKTNLLSATATGALAGNQNSGAAAFTGSTPNSVVIFSSDFLDFSQTTARNYSFSLSSVSPTINRDTSNSTVALRSFLRGFTAAGSGTFASNPRPALPTDAPEPGAGLLFGFGAVSLCGVVLRRRRGGRNGSA